MITECPICDRELGLDEEDHIGRCLDRRIAAAIAEEREATIQKYHAWQERVGPNVIVPWQVVFLGDTTLARTEQILRAARILANTPKYARQFPDQQNKLRRLFTLRDENEKGTPMKNFEFELRALLNVTSQESTSNTQDFILARYLVACLAAFNEATQQRETWHGRNAAPTSSEGTVVRAGAEETSHGQ